MPPAQCPECGRFLAKDFVSTLTEEGEPCPSCRHVLRPADFGVVAAAATAPATEAQPDSEAVPAADDTPASQTEPDPVTVPDDTPTAETAPDPVTAADAAASEAESEPAPDSDLSASEDARPAADAPASETPEQDAPPPDPLAGWDQGRVVHLDDHRSGQSGPSDATAVGLGALIGALLGLLVGRRRRFRALLFGAVAGATAGAVSRRIWELPEDAAG